MAIKLHLGREIMCLLAFSILILLSISLFSALTLGHNKKNIVYLDSCSILKNPNTVYYLTKDLIEGNSDSDAYTKGSNNYVQADRDYIKIKEKCMNIIAKNITLDCQGHFIINKLSPVGSLIYSAHDNTVIKNCNLQNFQKKGKKSDDSRGIKFLDVKNGMMENNTLRGFNSGIYIEKGQNYLMRDNRAYENKQGIVLKEIKNSNIVEGNFYNNSEYDIFIKKSKNVSFIGLNPEGFVKLIDRYSRVSWKNFAKNFTIIVIPDTQNYIGESEDIFTKQTQWIVDNKDRLNIKFAVHEGDIVSLATFFLQWKIANQSISILDGKVPYGLNLGNHDHLGDSTNGISKFENYFNSSRYKTEPWWGGSMDEKNYNSYQLLTIEGEDYVFLNLDWCPSDDELDWANSILTKYSGRKAIITTHAYLDQLTASTEQGVSRCNHPGEPNETTTYIWNMIKTHENVQIVLSGHEHDGPQNDDGEARRTDLNDAGKSVYQMLANYQGYDNGGNGYLRIMEFSPLEDKIYVKTYSPYLNSLGLESYRTGEKSQFVLDYKLGDFVDFSG